MAKLHITLDLFFQDWGTPQGSLWAALRPHVRCDLRADDPYAELVAWAESSAEGAAQSYVMVTGPHDPAKESFVGVNYPDDVNLTLEVRRAGDLAPTRLTVDRRTRLRILDAAAFQAENLPDVGDFPAAGSANAAEENAAAGQVQAVDAEPFAKAYNLGVRKARGLHTERPDPSKIVDGPTLAAMIDLAQSGGARRTLSPRSVARHQDPHLLRWRADDPDSGAVHSNLHSMLGHTIRLGGKEALDDLKKILQLVLVIEPAAGPATRLDLNALGGDFVTGFFPAIPERFDDTAVRLTWNQDLSRRAYVVDTALAFAHRPIGDQAWYARGRESKAGQGTPDDLQLDRAARLIVHIDEPAAETGAPGADPVPWPKRLEFEPYAELQAVFQPYRRFPVDAAEQGFLLRLIPSPEDRDDFYREVGRHGEADPFAEAIFLDGEGRVLPKDARPDFVACTDFFWDRADRPEEAVTLLYHGQLRQTVVDPEDPPEDQHSDLDGFVTILVPRKARLTANKVERGTLGPETERYWEVQFGPGTLPHVEFHRLLLRTAVPDAARLVPAVGFRGDVQFELAQSQSRIEAVATVAYPRIADLDGGRKNTPRIEFLDDLINHNTINVHLRESEGEPGELMNANEETYPVYMPPPSADRRALVFHFRFGRQAAPLIPPTAGTADAPAFFRRLFAQAAAEHGPIGAARKLDVTLEHTFGTELRHADGRSGIDVALPPLPLSSALDGPVALASEVKAAALPTGQNEQPGEIARFLTARFDGGHGLDERVTLTFDTTLLHWPPDASDIAVRRNKLALYTAAWRSVAELVFAQRVMLRLRLVRFNFHRAIGEGGQVSLGAGLETQPSEFDRDVTELLRDRLRPWLEGAPPDDGEFTITLSKAGDAARIHRLSNAFELLLDVARDPAKAPFQEAAAWQIVRPRSFDEETGERPDPVDLFDRDGLRIEVVQDGDGERLRRRFGHWLASLARRSDAIDPTAAEAGESEVFRRLVGGGPAGGPSGGERGGLPASTGDWIVPEGAVDRPPGAALVTQLPFTFRPIDPHPLLGDKTDLLLGRYLEMLGLILDCASRQRAANWAAGDWRKFFSGLSAARGRLETLFDRAAALIKAVNDVEDPHLSAQISETIRALDSGVEQSPLRKALHIWLKGRLSNNPRLFFDTKAFLYTRLEGTEQDRQLPKNFYRIRSRRRIVEAAGETAPPVDQPIELTIRESLTALDETPWFGFVETLDDRHYDNEMRPIAMTLDSFEAVIDRSLDAEGMRPSGAETTVPIERFEVPTGAVDPSRLTGSVPEAPGAASGMIHLVSRKRVIDPVPLASFQLDEMQRDDGLAGQQGRALSLPALLGGTLRAPRPGETAVGLVSTPPSPQARIKRLDMVVVSVLFAIEGDEETTRFAAGQPAPWRNALNNDLYSITIPIVDEGVAGHATSGATTAASAPTSDLKDLFAAIEDSSDLGEIGEAELAKAVSDGVLEAIGNAIKTTLPQRPKRETAATLAFTGLDAEAAIRVEARVPSTWPYPGALVEGHLLRPVSAGDTAGGNTAGGDDGQRAADVFYLLINLEVPVWHRYVAFGRQARNFLPGVSDEAQRGRRFAPDFGSFSERVSSGEPIVPLHRDSLFDVPVAKLQRKPLSIAELVDALLLRDDLIGDGGDWRRFDLSVTVYHEQRIAMPMAFVDAEGRVQERTMSDGLERFPLFTFQVSSAADPSRGVRGFDDAVDCFGDLHDHFQIDFQWSSPSNLQFFRLSERRIEILPEV